ncbi:hypothetical protein FRC04_002381 [Tulasnella sp. 424]|nr:hypothetical protein FRC04_002381 [Tulasnella sp. 424]KAG8968352.1 hypothetical protein FRC05_001576 [Tulasnella sp. 425]
MSFISRQTKPAHALVDAIRRARTSDLKGEVIDGEMWVSDLSPEPVPPATDRIWIDIRSSGLGEVLLDIVTQDGGGGPIDDEEVRLQISALTALYYIVINMQSSWNERNPLEKNLREKVMRINETLARLEKHKFKISIDLVRARELMPGPDVPLVQNAVVIVEILADNFGSLNDVSALIVSEYGVRRIIACFLFVLQDPAYQDSKMAGNLTGMLAVMKHLWADASIRRPFILDGRIHVHMMNRFWQFQPNRRKDDIVELGPSGLSAVSFLRDIVE